MKDAQAAPEKATLQAHLHDQDHLHDDCEEQKRQFEASAEIPTTRLVQFGSDDGVACADDTCWASPPTS